MMYSKKEDLKQFYRRINAYVEVTDEDISVYDAIDEKGKPSGFPIIYRNPVATLKTQPKKKKTDFKSAFAQFCDVIPIEEFIHYINQQADKRPKTFAVQNSSEQMNIIKDLYK